MLETSDEARRDGLDKALEARRGRSEAMAWVYGTIKSGDPVTFDGFEAMYASQPWFKRSKVERLFRAIPGVGTKTAPKVMADLDIERCKTIGGLGSRQRCNVSAKFDKMAAAAAARHSKK